MTMHKREFIMPTETVRQYYVEEITDGDRAVVGGPFPTKALADRERLRMAAEFENAVKLRTVVHKPERMR